MKHSWARLVAAELTNDDCASAITDGRSFSPTDVGHPLKLTRVRNCKRKVWCSRVAGRESKYSRIQRRTSRSKRSAIIINIRKEVDPFVSTRAQ